ncbi:MAG: flagellar biosynthesis protein FlhB [Lachnospiraceae bacterium]|nr:flagellar biosynthesis protein FlhB [Lachnospiraceae bacterium]
MTEYRWFIDDVRIVRFADGALLPYDLQWFGDDKTEDPTAKKLSDTRKKGQVGKSQELAHGLELVAMFIVLRVTMEFLGTHFTGIFHWVYANLIPDIITTSRSGLSVHDTDILIRNVLLQMMIIMAPFFIVGFVVAALSTGLQFKFQITWEPLKPKFDKFNPINGFKRIFSAQSLFNLALSLVKIVMISVIAYTSLADHVGEIFLLYEMDLNQAIALIGDLVLSTGLRISLVYIIIGIADLIFQKYKFKKSIKMTKQEVKDEYKDAEGDPQIKGQIKQRMREASQRRMMQNVPQADVVITNPDHFAVALKYDAEVAAAPVLVAKGADYLAEKIKSVARENDVPIVENKPLARTIYSSVEVDGEIPPELYQTVAEILAAIFSAKEGRF